MSGDVWGCMGSLEMPGDVWRCLCIPGDAWGKVHETPLRNGHPIFFGQKSATPFFSGVAISGVAVSGGGFVNLALYPPEYPEFFTCKL